MSETYVPTVLLSYMNAPDTETGRTKLLLHQLWVSELGGTDWRKVPIRAASSKNRAPVETVVFSGEEWDDRGMLVRREPWSE